MSNEQCARCPERRAYGRLCPRCWKAHIKQYGAALQGVRVIWPEPKPIQPELWSA